MPTARTFWLFLAAVTVVRIVVAALMPLTLDEPYYWLWSQHPALGYYDHPPLMAWLLALSTPTGTTPLSIRLAPLCCGTLCPILLFVYTRRLTQNESMAAAAAIAQLLAPYFSFIAVLASPEFALLVTWLAALIAWDGCLTHPRATGRWILAGLALGLCLLAKLTSAALAGGIVLFFVLSPRARRACLTQPGPYLAVLTAAAVYSPFLWWNARNGWPTFLLQATARTTTPFGFHPEHLPNFLAESMGGLSPFVFIAFIPALRLAWRDARAAAPSDIEAVPLAERLRLPLLVSIPPLLVFWAAMPFSLVQVYWTLCCWLGLYPFVGTWYVRALQGCGDDFAKQRRYRVAGAAAVVFTSAILGFGLLAAASPTLMFRLFERPGGSGITEVYGWRNLTDSLLRERDTMPRPSDTFLAAEDHRLASHFTLQLQRRQEAIPVMMFSTDRRGLEYLRWESPARLAGDDCVLLLREPFETDRERLRTDLQAVFDRVETPQPVEARWNGHVAQHFFTVRMYGFHPERSDVFTRILFSNTGRLGP